MGDFNINVKDTKYKDPNQSIGFVLAAGLTSIFMKPRDFQSIDSCFSIFVLDLLR